jgi:hypothetical protein
MSPQSSTLPRSVKFSSYALFPSRPSGLPPTLKAGNLNFRLSRMSLEQILLIREESDSTFSREGRNHRMIHIVPIRPISRRLQNIGTTVLYPFTCRRRIPIRVGTETLFHGFGERSPQVGWGNEGTLGYFWELGV